MIIPKSNPHIPTILAQPYHRDGIFRASSAILPHADTDPLHFAYAAPFSDIDPAELKRVEKEVKKEVDEAVESSKVGPIPPDSWLWRNVYADPVDAKLRQVDGTYITPTRSLDYSV